MKVWGWGGGGEGVGWGGVGGLVLVEVGLKAVGWIGRVACKGYLGLHPTITASTIVQTMMLVLVEALGVVFGLASFIFKVDKHIWE